MLTATAQTTLRHLHPHPLGQTFHPFLSVSISSISSGMTVSLNPPSPDEPDLDISVPPDPEPEDIVMPDAKLDSDVPVEPGLVEYELI